MIDISNTEYNRIMGIARRVSEHLGTQFWAEDFCNEYLADVVDGRFHMNGGSTHPYIIMLHYWRLWEKPRTTLETKLAYWKMCSRKPLLPSDFFELKELWESATEAEKDGIYSLMMNYGEGKRANGTVECIPQARRESSYLKNFRRKNGIKITNGNSKRTRIARRKRSMG